MATPALQHTHMFMSSRFNPVYPQQVIMSNTPKHKSSTIQYLYDAYQHQSNLLALNDAIINDNQVQAWQQQQQHELMTDISSDHQQQETMFSGFEPCLRTNSAASLCSSSATSINQHTYQPQHQQQQQHHHQHQHQQREQHREKQREHQHQLQQQHMQSGMFGQSSPTHYQPSQLEYMMPVSQHLHHHSLPIHSPVRPVSGEQSDRSSRDRDVGNAPNLVGHEGMPEPAPRPKGPKLKFTPAEDTLLVELKEVKGLTWKQIADFFPGRSPGTLQVRYCTKLKAKTTIWTEEMLQRLKCAMTEYENDRWRIISSKVGNGFSATACQEKAMECEGEAAGDFGIGDFEQGDSSEDDVQP